MKKKFKNKKLNKENIYYDNKYINISDEEVQLLFDYYYNQKSLNKVK